MLILATLFSWSQSTAIAATDEGSTLYEPFPEQVPKERGKRFVEKALEREPPGRQIQRDIAADKLERGIELAPKATKKRRRKSDPAKESPTSRAKGSLQLLQPLQRTGQSPSGRYDRLRAWPLLLVGLLAGAAAMGYYWRRVKQTSD